MIFALFTVVGFFALLKGVAWVKRDPTDVNAQNPYLLPLYIDAQLAPAMAQAAHNIPIKPSYVPSCYSTYLKPVLDTILSFFGLLLLSPVFLIIAVAILADNPGPVFFKQKRVGKGKTFFLLHKFRSMKMSSAHNVPTHQLSNKALPHFQMQKELFSTMRQMGMIGSFTYYRLVCTSFIKYLILPNWFRKMFHLYDIQA